MGQVLHGCATTTHAVRAAIQRSKASIPEIAEKYGLNEKTVRKWRKRKTVEDAPMRPKSPRSTVLSPEEEAACVAFRKPTLLPLDDCLYALQATIPHLTRSSLHRLYQRHDISRLPDVEGEKPKTRFKEYPIGYFHIDIAQVRTEEGKLYMFVAIDRTSKFAFVELHEKATRRVAGDFLKRLAEAVPYRIHTVLTDNGTHFTDPTGGGWTVAQIKGMLACKEIFRCHSFDLAWLLIANARILTRRLARQSPASHDGLLSQTLRAARRNREAERQLALMTFAERQKAAELTKQEFSERINASKAHEQVEKIRAMQALIKTRLDSKDRDRERD